MVLLVPCYSLASPCSPLDTSISCSSDELFYEVPSSWRPASLCDKAPQSLPEPIPLARCQGNDSTLSSSSDSISSFHSSCSTRSAAEREVERAARRRLLDVSVSKLQGQRDQPLRKHLLVYNAIKAIQHDLEVLDDEELFCTLNANAQQHAENMEVDECPWPQPRGLGIPPSSGMTKSGNGNVKNSWEDERVATAAAAHPQHQSPQPQPPLHSIQEAIGQGNWWESPASDNENSNDNSVAHWLANNNNSGNGAAGSSRDDERRAYNYLEPTHASSAPFDVTDNLLLWSHLDDMSANPLGHSWLSSGELSSMFAPHLHHQGASELLMQA